MIEKPTLIGRNSNLAFLRVCLMVLVCLSFLATEVAKANELLTDINLELIDLSEESESSEKEGKEDGKEKKEKRKIQPDLRMVLGSDVFLTGANFYQVLLFLDAHQEDPQPPPEV